jgi:hypothetical protein
MYRVMQSVNDSYGPKLNHALQKRKHTEALLDEPSPLVRARYILCVLLGFPIGAADSFAPFESVLRTIFFTRSQIAQTVPRERWEFRRFGKTRLCQ